MNRIVYIFITFVFGISLYLAFFCDGRNEAQYNTIRFHYHGEKQCFVALDKSGNSYKEDSSVKKNKGRNCVYGRNVGKIVYYNLKFYI